MAEENDLTPYWDTALASLTEEELPAQQRAFVTLTQPRGSLRTPPWLPPRMTSPRTSWRPDFGPSSFDASPTPSDKTSGSPSPSDPS